MNQRDVVFSLLKEFSGQANVLTIPRAFIDWTGGDWQTAAFISQLLYWSSRTTREDGFFFKSDRDWSEELGISEYQVRKAKDFVKENHIADLEVRKAKGAPTVHYRINQDGLMTWVLSNLNNSDIAKSQNGSRDQREIHPATSAKSLTETTTETTDINSGNGDLFPDGMTPQEYFSTPDPPPREPMTADQYRKRVMNALVQGAREYSGYDLSRYPADTVDFIRVVCDLWHLTPPGFAKGGNSSAGYWIQGARELREACAEFGTGAVEDYYREVYATGAEPPFVVSSPKSLVNVVRGHVGLMRSSEQETKTVKFTLEDGTEFNVMPEEDIE